MEPMMVGDEPGWVLSLEPIEMSLLNFVVLMRFLRRRIDRPRPISAVVVRISNPCVCMYIYKKVIIDEFRIQVVI